MNKALSKRIAQANRYIAFAREHGLWGIEASISTWPSLIEYTHPITVSPAGNVVTVRYLDHAAMVYGASSRVERKRHKFYTRRTDPSDRDGVADLRYEITHYVIRAIKSGAKEAGVRLPKYLDA
ncbi:MAG: hypothetical protein GY772_06880 [bacterium]|nr:hypothetical protein [bacterium]